ncbi:GNAT family N-acetyltransferase [Melissospora conviva]|uniref:GNAT family N-acetyltransferase n=1 Tax=Melissospora conviva TaxID=3388432 RepID=UPI003C164437
MSGTGSPELQLLGAGHAPAVLAFEVANRTWFAASVPDRGDDYFKHFAQRHHALLAEQESGRCAFHVLVADDGAVLSRFNLVDMDEGVATLGYRVAQQVAGRGVATATVQQLCRLATTRHGLHTINASVTQDNAASRRVLVKAGFVPVGPADPADLDGEPGLRYQWREFRD